LDQIHHFSALLNFWVVFFLIYIIICFDFG